MCKFTVFGINRPFVCLFNTGLKCCDSEVSRITKTVLIKLQHSSTKKNHVRGKLGIDEQFHAAHHDSCN